MFDSTSRYSAIRTVTLTAADGRAIAYKQRRFLPQAGALRVLVDVTLTQGDRLDLVAARTIGDPRQFWRICDANDTMNPFDLEEVGLELRVPVPEVIS
jgi:hypothetical protein